jgi:hypothetical protein
MAGTPCARSYSVDRWRAVCRALQKKGPHSQTTAFDNISTKKRLAEKAKQVTWMKLILQKQNARSIITIFGMTGPRFIF